MAMIGRKYSFVLSIIIALVILGILLIIALQVHERSLEAESIAAEFREFNVSLVTCAPAKVSIGITEIELRNKIIVPILGRTNPKEIHYSDKNAIQLNGKGQGSGLAEFDVIIPAGEQVVVGVWQLTACLDATIPETDDLILLLQECAVTFVNSRTLRCEA